jgi:hypothetical protein
VRPGPALKPLEDKHEKKEKTKKESRRDSKDSEGKEIKDKDKDSKDSGKEGHHRKGHSKEKKVHKEKSIHSSRQCYILITLMNCSGGDKSSSETPPTSARGPTLRPSNSVRQLNLINQSPSSTPKAAGT